MLSKLLDDFQIDKVSLIFDLIWIKNCLSGCWNYSKVIIEILKEIVEFHSSDVKNFMNSKREFNGDYVSNSMVIFEVMNSLLLNLENLKSKLEKISINDF